MSKIDRSSIVDFVTYEDRRDEIRQQILAVKRPRRIHLGEYLTFLFENSDTMRYQVQEMMRAERIVRERDIQHEIDTYNEVLGDVGELGCTLLIEIDDPEKRDVKLVRWMGLPEALYLRLEDGETVGAQYDARQVGETRLSSVQYLKFSTGGRKPVAIGSSFDDDEVGLEQELTSEQAAALAADLLD